MFDLIAGLVLVVAWAVLQYAVQPATGWIHVALAAGVLGIIRGIVRLSPGTPVKR